MGLLTQMSKYSNEYLFLNVSPFAFIAFIGYTGSGVFMSNSHPTLPSERDSTLAGAGLELLTQHGQKDMTVRLEGEDKILTLSAPMVALLQRVFEELAQGKAVDVVSLESELSTQQAADVLNVSRPFVVKLLDEGVLPHRLVGSHRRVMLKDVLEYREQTKRKRRAALRELTQLSQELGLYDELPLHLQPEKTH
jgi:excisionase family DNA binding protein